MTIQPMIVLLLGSALLKDRIQPVHLVACLVGAVGVALLVLQPHAGLDGVGVLAGLLGALSMASGIVLTKRWGRPEGVGLLTFTGWQLTVGGLVLLPVTLVGEGLPDHLTWTNVGGFAYLSVIGALIAYVLWFRGLSRLLYRRLLPVLRLTAVRDGPRLPLPRRDPAPAPTPRRGRRRGRGRPRPAAGPGPQTRTGAARTRGEPGLIDSHQRFGGITT